MIAPVFSLFYIHKVKLFGFQAVFNLLLDDSDGAGQSASDYL